MAPTKEILLGFAPRLVEELWLTCVDAAKTVKKRGDVEETLENTQGGSPGLRVVGQVT